MESWNDITIAHRGERVTIDGVGFSAIGRLKLLQLLQARARSVGVEPVYRRTVKSLDELGDADLVVGTDGVNSLVRRGNEERFGASMRFLSNRFAWFGTGRRFETLTQTFVETDAGSFNAHHYRYAPDLSTFIVEVDGATFARAGFGQMDEEQTRSFCERVFAQALDGNQLISNKLDLAAIPNRSQRALVGSEMRACRRRLAHRPFLNRLRARASPWRMRLRSTRRLTHSADIGTALAAYEAATAADPRETGGRCQRQRDLVRAFCRAHATCAGRFCHELCHPFRPNRHRPVAKLSPRFVACYERQRGTT